MTRVQYLRLSFMSSAFRTNSLCVPKVTHSYHGAAGACCVSEEFSKNKTFVPEFEYHEQNMNRKNVRLKNFLLFLTFDTHDKRQDGRWRTKVVWNTLTHNNKGNYWFFWAPEMREWSLSLDLFDIFTNSVDVRAKVWLSSTARNSGMRSIFPITQKCTNKPYAECCRTSTDTHTNEETRTIPGRSLFISSLIYLFIWINLCSWSTKTTSAFGALLGATSSFPYIHKLRQVMHLALGSRASTNLSHLSITACIINVLMESFQPA